MNDQQKTKSQLISELEDLRHRVAQLEAEATLRQSQTYDSTSTKLAEEALKETEQRVNKLIETAQEAIWIIDAKANTTFVNHRLGDMLGYAKEELLGHSVFDFVDDADRGEAIEYLERGRDGIKEQHDFRFRRRDGSELWTMISTTPLFDRAGGFIGGLAMLIDITERRRSEHALKESEARLQAAIENLPFELWVRDNDGRCIIQNPYSVLQWGSFFQTFPDEIEPDSAALALWNSINRRAYGGEVVKGEIEILGGAQAGWYYYVVGPIRVEGEIRGILGVKIDITDRKRMERALRQSEATFRVLAQTIPAVIFIFRDSNIVYANSYAEAHSGYTEQELRSMDFWQLIHPDHRELVKERGLARLRGEPVPSRYEFKLITKGGQERWVDYAASLFEFEGQASVLGAAFDINDRKQAEDKLLKAQERLRRVVSYSPAIIYSLKVEQGRVRPEWVSDSLTRLTGYELDEALSERWWSQHIHPDDQERALANLQRLLDAGHLVHEYRFRHKDGKYLWLQDESTLLRDDSGRGIEVIGSCVDITERRETEAALRESEERFRTLVGSMDDIVVTVDRQHRYTEFFGRWIGERFLKHESFVGKTPTEILGARDGQAHEDAIERGLSGEQVVYEWSSRVGEKRFHFQTCFSPIRDKTGAVTGLVGVGRDITDIKQAEEALRASEERYRDLVENARDIIYSHDLEGNYTSVNKAGERITGYTRHEALKLNFGQTVAPEYIERARQMIAAKLAGEKETVYTLEIIAKDGRRVTVEVNTRLVLQGDVPVGIQGIARDVTARKRAEEALRASQERFHRYFDLGLIGMAITSPTKRYLEVNDQLCETLGYDRSEMLQMTWADTTHPDDLAANIGNFNRVLAGETDGYSMEKRYIRKDGSVIDTTISVKCLRCPDGSIDYFVALTQDITARKQAEQALRESQSRLQAILDYCPLLIFLKHGDGRYLQINRVFERTFNLTSEESLGRTDEELFPPDQAAAFRVTDCTVIEAGRPMQFEEQTLNAGALHTYLVHKFPLHDDSGKVYAVGAISTDITELKQAEDELRKQKEILQKIFDHIPVMIRFSDADGRVTLANREWQRTLGWSLEELESRGVDIFVEAYPDPEYRQGVLNFITASTGEFADFKTKTRDGRVIDTTFANIRLEDGTNIGIGQDITERIKEKQALELSAKRYRDLVELTHDLVWAVDTEGRITYMSPASLRFYGREPEEMLGRLYTDFVSEEEARRGMAVLEMALTTGEIIRDNESRMWHKNGSEVILLANAVPRWDDAGNIVGWVGTAQDITKRRQVEQSLQRHAAQLAAIHEIELEISAEGNMSRILEVVTRRAAELLDASHCSTYINGRDEAGLKIVASMEPKFVGLRLEAGEGLAGRVFVTGDAQIVDDYSEWQGRTHVFDNEGFGPVMATPLKWRQTPLGALSLSRKRGKASFTGEDLRLLKQLSAVAAIAIHQATMFDEVLESQRRLQTLSHRLIDAQEAERKRLSRELHDQIGQALTAVQISLQALQSALDGTAAAPLDECLLAIDDTLQQVHDLSLDLRPSLLDDLGLVAALRWYVDRVASRAGLVRSFNADVNDVRLAPQVETACFRIAQEALTNVLRHAHATTVWVGVNRTESGLQLVVRDDGVGFDVRSTMSRTGVNASLGLQGMQERAAAVGGNIDIVSQREQGVEVLVSFPLC